jgi:hypothetical protein
MEVHHHSHHPQKWKEYLSEFLMLFFAVFLGFMAEYYLEYRAERHKEHDYINGMALDLKSDSAEMAIRIQGMESLKRMGKKLEKLLYKSVFTDDDIDSIYLISTKITATLIAPNFSSGTIDQLKNAGGYRLIKNQEIVRKISDYDRWKKTINLQESVIMEHWVNAHKMQNGIIHMTTIGMPEKLNEIILDKNELNRIEVLTGSKFLNSSKKALYEYANYIWVLGGYVSYYEIMIKMQQQNANELLKLIDKELDH